MVIIKPTSKTFMASFSLSDIVKVSTPFAGPVFDNALSGVAAREPGEGAAGIEFAPDIILARSIPDNTIVTNNLL